MRRGCTLIAVAWLASSLAAHADIYQSTADDGALTLSNLPGARREVLVAEPPSAEAAGPAASAARPAAVQSVAGPARQPGSPLPADGRPINPSAAAAALVRDSAAPSAASSSPLVVLPGSPLRERTAPGGQPLQERAASAAEPGPVARPPSVELALHFAPGAPGAPAWSAPSAAPQADWKGAEAGWQRTRREAPAAQRAMPVEVRPAASWLALAPAEAAPVAGASDAAEAAEYRIATDDIVAAVAVKHALDPALLHAIVTVESAYNSRAVSPRGATGLMQMLPETARRYGVRDLFDPVQNLTAGALYLRDLLLLFKQDLSLALAAYNAGENAVIRHGNAIPPYPETQNYVPRVLATYRAYARFFAQRRTPL